MSHKGRQYTRELSAGQWARLKWLFPPRKGAGRPMELPLRGVVEAILYVVVTGCQWANVPKGYPNPKSVFYHFRKWSEDGTWQRINRARVWLERQRVGRIAQPSGGVVDSQSVKTMSNGA